MRELSKVLASRADEQNIKIQALRNELKSEVGVIKMAMQSWNKDNIDTVHKMLDLVVMDLERLLNDDIHDCVKLANDIGVDAIFLRDKINSVEDKPKQVRTRRTKAEMEALKKTETKVEPKVEKKAVVKKSEPAVKKETENKVEEPETK